MVCFETITQEGQFKMINSAVIKFKPYGKDTTCTVEIAKASQLEFEFGHELSGRCLVVYDKNIQWFIPTVCENLTFKGFEPTTFGLDIKLKDMDSALKICNKLIECQPGFSVAIGGGTTCDLTGFASSIYHRGIPVIYFPTTLLAMADVCVSGKTGIDYGNIKNSLGTIHFPLLSICVIDTLQTLNEGEFRSGLSEIVKVAVTSDKIFFHQLETVSEKINNSFDGMYSIIESSCHLKARLVESVPTVRLHSLYGHVIGQALESLGIGRYRHGDCVSIGLNAEGYIAWKLGLWGKDNWIRQRNLLEALSLPLTIPRDIKINEIVRHIRNDKLSTQSHANLILPIGMGEMYSQSGDPRVKIPYDLIFEYLREFEEISSKGYI